MPHGLHTSSDVCKEPVTQYGLIIAACSLHTPVMHPACRLHYVLVCHEPFVNALQITTSIPALELNMAYYA